MSTEVRSCEDALRLLAAYLDGELHDASHAEVDRHLSKCRSCYSRAEFERRLKVRLAELGRAPVEAALRARVQHMIQQFAVARSNERAD
jgi:anti-sigma factor (TIGR02949 family)